MGITKKNKNSDPKVPFTTETVTVCFCPQCPVQGNSQCVKDKMQKLPEIMKTIGKSKALKSQEVLLELIKQSENENAVAVGVDIDGAGSVNFALSGKPPGVADVLPEIVKAVRETKKGKRVAITADGGVRTGFDGVKMIALGADFVLVGRPLAREAVSSGVEGVKRILEYLKTDFKIAMIMTSCNTLKDINETILIKGD